MMVYSQEAEQLFRDGLNRFRAQHYDRAILAFEQILTAFPNSHRTTGASIIAAKAYYRLGQFDESIKLCRRLVTEFPTSSYADDARYTAALGHYRLGRYDVAAAELLWVAENSNDRLLAERSEQLLDELSKTALTVSHLQSLLNEARSSRIRPLLTLRLAERLYRTAEKGRAQEMLRTLLGPEIRSDIAEQARALYEAATPTGTAKIGVLLPLMQNSDDPSEGASALQMLEGIQLALEEYNENADTAMSLEVRDTGRNPWNAERLTTELCNDPSVVAIIGPIYSDETRASGTVANAYGVPLISPTATAVGIGEIGPYVFQANPDYVMRGRALALFASRAYNAKRFGVLAPIDPVGRQMTEGFLAEVELLGGEMVDVQWYDVGATDLRAQLMAMRMRAFEQAQQSVVEFSARSRPGDVQKILAWGVPRRVVDSLIQRQAAASVEFLFGPDGRRVADSLGISVRVQRHRADSLAIPVPGLDALFLPITSAEEMGIVGSQIRYFNFQSLLLGSGEWNDLAELDRNRHDVSGVIFSADGFADSESRDYAVVESRYLRAFRRRPSTNALLAYDVSRLLFEILKEGNRTRRDIATALSSVRGYEGVQSRFSFDARGVNGCFVILQYRDRSIRRVGEVDLVLRRAEREER